MSTYQGQPTTADLSKESGGKGLAIASLVCSIAGFCVPLAGIVGIVLGVIVVARGASRWRGLAIGGIACGALSTVVMLIVVLMAGLTLPRLAGAPAGIAAAREIKSSIQMRQIALVLIETREDGGSLPAAGDDLQHSLLGTIEEELWVSPSSDGALPGGSYLYLPPPQDAEEATTPLLVERPEVPSRKLNIAFLDGHVETLPRAHVEALLRQALPNVFTADGKRWSPQP